MGNYKKCDKLIKFQAKRKGLHFYIENHLDESSKNAFILSDSKRIQQVILNLLGNSLKFTESGYIRISLEIPEQSYLIKVSDTGLGIKEEDQPKLFKLFGRLKDEESVSRNKNNNEFNEYNKSENTVNSNILIREHKRNSSLGKISRILVVDDDLINLLVTSSYLKSYGDYIFDTANNGKEAVQTI